MFRRKNLFIPILMASLLLLATSGSVFAQLQSGNVYGVVTDTQGNVVGDSFGSTAVFASLIVL